MNKNKLLFGIDGLPNYISHSGRKGMKWGVRNGPPYPLGVKTSEYKEMQSSNYGHKLSYEQGKRIADRKRLRPILFKPNSTISQHLYATDRYKLKHDGEIKQLKDLSRKQNSSTFEDMKKVNPRSGFISRGTYDNCVNCSIAIDMRRRGYDVRARVTNEGIDREELPKFYEGGKLQHMDIPERKRSEKARIYMSRSINKIGDILEQQGPNARGIIGVMWQDNFGGHALYWENDSNSKLTIYDGQNKEINPNDVFAMCDPTETYYMRTDNLEPTEEIAKHITDKME